MHTLAKMAEMAINCQNHQISNNNSDDMAKGPLTLLKGENCQILNNKLYKVPKGPF